MVRSALALALVVGGVGAATGLGGSPPPADGDVLQSEPAGPVARSDATNDVTVSYTYRRLPGRPGVVGVTMGVTVTPAVDRLSFEFDDDLEVLTTAGVTQNGSTYEWTGNRTAAVTYRFPVDWSYTGNTGESWTLVGHRSPTVDAGSGVDVRRRIRTAGEGYVANRTVLLGAHDVYSREVAGETVNLVVPAGVSLLYGPDRTADALANASRMLRIGERDGVVHAVATPEIRTEAEFLVQPGFALDDETLLVDADSELDVWTHEYVHTRQAFSDAESLRWLTEGSAEYYGWLLSIRQGYDDWAPLRGVLSSARGDDSVLTDPDSWAGDTDYRKGALVLAALDREIRTATDGERTLQDVLRQVNGADTDPTLGTLLDAVREVGGPEAAGVTRRYLTTSATPAYRPSRDKLAATYGYATPQIRTEVTAVSAVGTEWTRPLEPRERPQIGRNETLRFTVRVTNAGDADGVAAVAPRVSARETELDRVDDPWVGRLRPGETVTRTVTHRFDQSGPYDVDPGLPDGVRVVPERETATVTGLNATRNRTAGGRVVVEATVRNDATRSTFVRRRLSLDGRRVSTVALVVGPNATRTVTRSVRVAGRTQTEISVGTASTTVDSPATVPSPSSPASPDTERGTVDPPAATEPPRTGGGLALGRLLGGLCVLVAAGLAVLWLGSRSE